MPGGDVNVEVGGSYAGIAAIDEGDKSRRQFGRKADASARNTSNGDRGGEDGNGDGCWSSFTQW